MSGEDRGDALSVVSTTSLYSHLVTRQTGRAVRLSIEERLELSRGPLVSVLDFREVTVIDFSCADEVVAKLAHTAIEGQGLDTEIFFLFRGLDEHHLDPVESAVERRSLAIAAEGVAGEPFLLGPVEREARRVWEAVCASGRARPEGVARELGLDRDAAREHLAALHSRRLLLRRAGRYLSLHRAVHEADPGAGQP